MPKNSPVKSVKSLPIREDKGRRSLHVKLAGGKHTNPFQTFPFLFLASSNFLRHLGDSMATLWMFREWIILLFKYFDCIDSSVNSCF